MHLTPYTLPSTTSYPDPQSGWLVGENGSELNLYLTPEHRPDGSVIFTLRKGIGSPEHDEVLGTYTVEVADVDEPTPTTEDDDE